MQECGKPQPVRVITSDVRYWEDDRGTCMTEMGAQPTSSSGSECPVPGQPGCHSLAYMGRKRLRSGRDQASDFIH